MITNITERERELRAANSDLRTEIERLENEAVAATIRMDNDALEIASLRQQYADSMAHQNNAYNRRVAERDALAADAARYRWLTTTHQSELGSGGKFDLPKYGVLNFAWEKYEWIDGRLWLTQGVDDAIDSAMKGEAK